MNFSQYFTIINNVPIILIICVCVCVYVYICKLVPFFPRSKIAKSNVYIFFKRLFTNAIKLLSSNAVPIKNSTSRVWVSIFLLNLLSHLLVILGFVFVARIFQFKHSSLFSCWFLKTLYWGFLPLPYVLLLSWHLRD